MKNGTRSIALETLVSIAGVLERPLSFFLASEEILVVRETKLGEIVCRVRDPAALAAKTQVTDLLRAKRRWELRSYRLQGAEQERQQNKGVETALQP